MNYVLSNKATFLGILLLVPVALNSMEPKFCPEDITDQPPIKQKVEYALTMKALDLLMVKAVLLKENKIEQNTEQLLKTIQQTREDYWRALGFSKAVSIVNVPNVCLSYWFNEKDVDPMTKQAFELRGKTEHIYRSEWSAYTKVGDMAKNKQRSPFEYYACFDNFDELEAVVKATAATIDSDNKALTLKFEGLIKNSTVLLR